MIEKCDVIEYKRLSQIMARTHKRGMKVPGSECSWERILLSTKVPGSELARVLLADSLPGANWPGSEKAVNLLSLNVVIDPIYPIRRQQVLVLVSVAKVFTEQPKNN